VIAGFIPGPRPVQTVCKDRLHHLHLASVRCRTFLQPSLFSSNPNGGALACFGLGPDLTGIDRPAQPLYVIFDPTAAEDHCDGDPTMLRHEHILSVAPGYTGDWRLVLRVETDPESIDLGISVATVCRRNSA